MFRYQKQDKIISEDMDKDFKLSKLLNSFPDQSVIQRNAFQFGFSTRKPPKSSAFQQQMHCLQQCFSIRKENEKKKKIFFDFVIASENCLSQENYFLHCTAID